MESREKRNKRIGLITSIGVHGLLVVLFLLSMAWRAPDPPHPEFGIELNFGTDAQGSGTEPVPSPTATDADVVEEEIEEEPVPEEPVEQQQPESDDKPVEEVITSKLESDVPAKEEKEKIKEEVKNPAPEKKEEVKKVEPEKVKVEYKKEDAKATDQPTENKGNQPLSEGNDKNKPGDKGDPKGTLDPNASYTGKPGGGGGGDGLSLAMSGWAWADQPKIGDLSDTQPGKVTFEIECDEDGEIVRVTPIERGLSPKTEQMLIEAIRKSSLMRTAGGQVPPRSTGRVVFVLKAR